MTTFKLKKTPKEVGDDRLKEVFERIDKKFRTLGLRVPPRPVGEDGEPLDPVLPPDLTALSDQQLGRLFSQFACMAQYIQLYLARRGVETAVYKSEEKKLRAKVRLEKSGTSPDKDAKAEVDPRVREMGFHYLVAEGAWTMTDAAMNAFLIGRDATSREMTRRISLLQNGRAT